MNQILKKKCIVCLNEYKTNTNGISSSGKRNFRNKQALTCSKKCSRVYERIREHVYNNCKGKLK